MSRRVSFNELMAQHNDIYDNPNSCYDDRKLIELAPKLLAMCMNDNLTKTQKCYIMLYYKQNMTVTQIAKMYNVNKSTVSRTIHRGRNRLLKSIRCEVLRKSLKD